MKELSIEEKAKAYDEAKARMSRAFNSNRCTIGFMNEIFPELRENWDERIRTKLIEFFSGYNTDEEWWGSITEKDILAWLEKQGESTDIPADAVLDSNKDGLIADTIQLKPKFKVGDIIRHKEQGCTCKITAIDTTTAEYGVSECSGTHLPFDFQDAWELVEQKPAEWSEEDREYMKSLLDIINGTSSLTPSEVKCHKDWLKSLKDRVQPQFTWKPSDRQMNVLEYYMHTLACNEHKEILFGLYQDLKKLKE